MQKLLNWTLALGTAATLVTGTSAAARNLPDRSPCDPNSTEEAGSVAAEQRVADWVVQQVLDVGAAGDPVVDYNAEQIERGTGVDAEHLDLDAVRERVQAKLRERECWGDVRLRPAQDSRDATHDRSNAGAKDESAGSGSAAGRGATAAHPGGSRSQH